MLALLGDHLTHAEIAARLVISIRTVETHVAALRRKLELPAHRDLVRYAAARGGAEKPGGALRASAAPLSSFVGRERERAELADAVRESRVVSVIGPGGAGKTRRRVSLRIVLSTKSPQVMRTHSSIGSCFSRSILSRSDSPRTKGST